MSNPKWLHRYTTTRKSLDSDSLIQDYLIEMGLRLGPPERGRSQVLLQYCASPVQSLMLALRILFLQADQAMIENKVSKLYNLKEVVTKSVKIQSVLYPTAGPDHGKIY